MTLIVAVLAHITGPRRSVKAGISFQGGTVVHVGPGFRIAGNGDSRLTVGFFGPEPLVSSLVLRLESPDLPSTATLVPMEREGRAFHAVLPESGLGAVHRYAFRVTTGPNSARLPSRGWFSLRTMAKGDDSLFLTHIALGLGGVFLSIVAAGEAERLLRSDLPGRVLVLAFLAAAAGIVLGTAAVLNRALLQHDGFAGSATTVSVQSVLAFFSSGTWLLAAVLAFGAFRAPAPLSRAASICGLLAAAATLASALLPHTFS